MTLEEMKDKFDNRQLGIDLWFYNGEKFICISLEEAIEKTWQAAQAEQQKKIAEMEKKYQRAVKMMIYISCEDCRNYECDGVCDEFIWEDFIANDANFNTDNTLKEDTP